jgi:hypothetical protein
MNSSLMAGVLSATVLAAASALGCVNAADDDAALAQRIGADWNAYDALIIGHPLSTTEQQQTLKAAAARLASNRDDALRADSNISRALANAKRYPARAGGTRESLRYLAAAQPANDPWRQFIEAHDPTIAFDRKHRRLVTEASLVTLQRACTLFTGIVHEPGPDSGFISRARNYLRAHFSDLPPNQQEAIAHVGRDLPIIRYDARHAQAARMVAFVKATHPLLTRQEQLAPNTIAVLAPLDRDIATNAALTNQIVMHSLMLNGQANTNMLLHGSWTTFGTPGLHPGLYP